MKIDIDEIGVTIAEVRAENDLTQTKLAKRVNMSRGSIANVERGFDAPSLRTIRKIFDVLGYDVSISLKKKKVKPSDPDPNVFTYHESFAYGFGGKAYEEAELFLESIGMEMDYCDAYSPDGNYYVRYNPSDHERDSSGDNLTVYIKIKQ